MLRIRYICEMLKMEASLKKSVEKLAYCKIMY